MYWTNFKSILASFAFAGLSGNAAMANDAFLGVLAEPGIIMDFLVFNIEGEQVIHASADQFSLYFGEKYVSLRVEGDELSYRQFGLWCARDLNGIWSVPIALGLSVDTFICNATFDDMSKPSGEDDRQFLFNPNEIRFLSGNS